MTPHHFLSIADLSERQLRACLRLAARCKRNPRLGARALEGRVLALVFQKPSVRTRVSFEVAVRQLGGSAMYLGPDDAQLGTREPIKDVARTLSRYVDGIIVRTFRHSQVEEFARYASVPVINGLSELHHPCQALADLFTMQERFGGLKGRTVSYVGDGNNVLHSLAQAAAILGLHLRVATPDGYRPNRRIWRETARRAARRGARLAWVASPQDAARGADVLYTDVWTSMGQERERAARLKAFRRFQVNRRLLSEAARGCIVMHCLPAHRGEEITEDVLESRQSVVFDQAENRLHAQKALLMMVYGGRS
ncbi:MAG: ornithine carbamoyltransferase [Candidatus Omnitrophica bacterium]|nr:ornithine carbamoyltransferase [Candidatus Omnitrophota bacterium]